MRNRQAKQNRLVDKPSPIPLWKRRFEKPETFKVGDYVVVKGDLSLWMVIEIPGERRAIVTIECIWSGRRLSKPQHSRSIRSAVLSDLGLSIRTANEALIKVRISHAEMLKKIIDSRSN